MNQERRRQVEDLFEAVLELDEASRAAQLESVCAGDPALMAEVQAMLAAHELAEELFASTAGGASLPDIGPYRVIRELGRGGMGIVYLAERADGQYRRRVAIKLMSHVDPGDEVRQRLLAERQILAGLDHPFIGGLLDGGVTPDGRPYLVLEYVDGLPISDYCDRQRLAVEERLQLFLDVCAAVQHAHTNLVIHRDLKPGNILVTATGQVRLLDFGIAKLLNPTLGRSEVNATRVGLRLMTPEYASPEQVRGEPLSTASDIYSLGVLLYELLCGLPPYRLPPDAPLAAATMVCDHEPASPGSRVDAGADAVRRAQLRGLTPDALRRRLHGDLDSIVLMALRKEPTRRYGSADLLAQDIRRHLDGLPVIAHRGSRRYRLGKLVRRHRVPVAAAGMVAISLAAGLGASLWQAGIARQQRGQADAARVAAQQAREQSDEVTAFLMGLFQVGELDAGRDDDGELTARDLLRRGTVRAEELADRPLVQARLLDVLGQMHHRIGDYAEGGRLLDRAVAIRRSRGAPAEDLAQSLLHRARVHRSDGDYEVARRLVAEALELRSAALGATHPRVGEAYYDLGYLLQGAPQEQHYRQAIDLLAGSDSMAEMRLSVMQGLATNLRRQGRLPEAVSQDREALAFADRHFGPQHYLTGMAMVHLADQVRDLEGDLPSAEMLYRRGLELITRQFGERDMRLIHGLTGLGRLLSLRGEHVEAETLYRRALVIHRAARGPGHPNSASMLVTLALELQRQGRLAEAEANAREGLAGMRDVLGPAHPVVAGAMLRLASILADQSRWAETDRMYRDAIAIHLAGESQFNVRLAEARREYAAALLKQSRLDEAEPQLAGSLAILESAYADPDHDNIRTTKRLLMQLYQMRGQPEMVERYRVPDGPLFRAY